MSARSSVTRQTSQGMKKFLCTFFLLLWTFVFFILESDANNNFGGSALVNGQGVQFVTPNTPLPPNSFNPQAAAAMQQQFQRMAAPNGANPSAAYRHPR